MRLNSTNDFIFSIFPTSFIMIVGIPKETNLPYVIVLKYRKFSIYETKPIQFSLKYQEKDSRKLSRKLLFFVRLKLSKAKVFPMIYHKDLLYDQMFCKAGAYCAIIHLLTIIPDLLNCRICNVMYATIQVPNKASWLSSW